VTQGADAESGVSRGRELLAFADAVIAREPEAIAQARSDLIGAVGEAGMVDAAGVVGNFERMNRIADAIGIPSDYPMQAMTQDIQQQLGLRRFASASHTPPATGFQRGLGRVLRAVLPIATRLMPGGQGKPGDR
jgi:hypothetical protein